MIKKLFGLFADTGSTPTSDQAAKRLADEALFRQIAERSKTDPLIGAKIGSEEVLQRLAYGIRTDHGVHVESLLVALGALAGYSCQASLRARAVAKGATEDSLFTVVKTEDGKTFFFGDHINEPLIESRYSIWSLAAAGARDAGCTVLPDVTEIFKHVSQTVGAADFGKPRVRTNYAPHDSPLNYLKRLWPVLFPTIQGFCPDPEHWPILLGLAIQQAIDAWKQAIEPSAAVRLVMEAAVPMSKVNLAPDC